MINSIEKERVAHINAIMDDIHQSINAIYEALIDMEHEDLKKEVICVQKKFKSILNSIEEV